jgi:hypothetical protein
MRLAGRLALFPNGIGGTDTVSMYSTESDLKDRGLSVWKYFLCAAIQSVAMSHWAVDKSSFPEHTIS